MAACHAYVRKIRPTDPAYGSASGDVFPWLCLPHRNATFGRGFRTQAQAFRFAERVANGAAIIVG